MGKNENVLKNGSKKLVDRTGNKDYYIGLDIGTNSVGWALTDDKYNLQKVRSDKKDKSTWGVRSFEKADTAKGRRMSRSMRRRYDRRRVRLNYLKALFAPEINKIDPSFFKRLENSYLYVNKDNMTGPRIDYANKNNIKLYQKSNRFHLFEGEGITDEEYYRDFPTIYHLRSALITGKITKAFINDNNKVETKSPYVPSYNLYDPRLVFLALHSLLKSRGHFLFDIDMDSYKNGDHLKENIESIADILSVSIANEPNYKGDLVKLYKNELTEQKKDKNSDDKNKVVEYKIKTKNAKIKKFKELVKVKSNASEIDVKERQDLFYNIIELSFGKTKFEKSKDTETSLLEGLEEEVEIDFSDEKFEGKLQKLEDINNKIGAAIRISYEIYVWAILSGILKGEKYKYICEGKIETYNKHKEDLHNLKCAIREILKDDVDRDKKFKQIFDKQTGCFTYDAYVHHREGKGDGAKKEEEKSRLKKFEKYIDEIISNGRFKEYKENNENGKKIEKEIKDGTFLPVLRSTENSIVPNAVIKKEYYEILEKAKENGLSFLDEKDKSKFKNDGSKKTPYDKILSLVDFKIPYYVGPLAYERSMGIDDEEKEESIRKWVVRNKGYEDKEIMPWVFDEAINKGETRKVFIDRMVSDCTYLRGCKVLPKNSIYYQKMLVLEELNNIRITINNNAIPYDSVEAIKIKQYVFKNVYEKKVSPPTVNQIKTAIASYCKENYGDAIKGKDIELSKIGGEDDTKFKHSLTSYFAFKNAFETSDGEENPLQDSEKEELIKLYTVFGKETEAAKEETETKENKEEKLKKYNSLDESIKNKIHNALSKISGWGKYSKEFLTELTVKNQATGTSDNILTWLWNTNYNISYLMRMQTSDGNFEDRVNEFNKNKTQTKNIRDIKFKDIDALYVSISTKRAIWQTIRIIKELVRIAGCPPKKIFVETTRGDGEKGKTTTSRHDSLKEKYNSDEIRTQAHEIQIDIDNDLSPDLETYKNNLSSERLYLYFMQCGRDMYTGDIIPIGDVINGVNYDTDHIFARSLTDDDSVIDNKVLVSKTLNEDIKGNKTLMTSGVIKDRNKVEKLWKFLRDKEFISKEKYRRLEYSLNHERLEESEVEGFINRQIVETSQSTKAVMSLLKNCSFKVNSEDSSTEIVPVKAHLVSEFRNKNMMYKSRTINDMHHAKDAYLNIVVGNVYNTELTHNHWKEKLRNGGDLNISSDIYNKKTIKSSDGTIAWVKEETIKTVGETMNRDDVLLTRMQTTGKGELFEDGVNSFKIKMYNNKAKNSKLPDVDAITSIKDKDVYYGYKDGGKGVVFFVYKQGKGKNKKAYICGLPQYYYYRLKQENKPINEIIESYITNVLKKKDVELIDNIILKQNFLLEKEDSNGMFIGYASGGTDLKQAFFPLYGEFEPYAMQICKFFEKRGKDRNYSLSDFNFRKELYKDKDHKVRDYAKEDQRDAKRPKLTIKKNIEFLNFIVDLHKTESFKNRSGSIDKKSKKKSMSDLEKVVQIFPELPKIYVEDQEDQLETLYNLIKYMNGERVKLPKTIKGYYKRDEYGNYLDKNGEKTTDLGKRIRLNEKEIFNDCGRMNDGDVFRVEKGEIIKVINQSVTGLFENSFTISLDEE